jgi:transforming growth factor-beta-induced protein
MVDTLRTKSEFTTLVAAIDAVPKLAATLTSGNYTLFAPTNNAFGRLSAPPDLTDTTGLTNLLSYHVVPNVLIEKYDFNDGFLTTLQGQAIEVNARRKNIELNDVADVDDFNILASNAIIHKIDRVLTPPAPLVNIVATASARGDLSTFVTALTNASLVNFFQLTTRNSTCFLPSNKAFSELPAGVLESLLANTTALTPLLLYHCVPGTMLRTDLASGRLTTLMGEDLELDCRKRNHVRINDDVDVEEFDIRASNGVIHVIDEVLDIPAPLLTIADYLATDSDFATLNTVLKSSGLDAALRGSGNFTLFAPNERAFEKLGTVNVAALQANVTALTEVLSYHAVNDELVCSQLKDTVVKTSNGANLRIDVTSGGKRAYLNGWVKVKEFDIVCSNGVIHGIRNVLTVPVNLFATIEATGLTTLATAIKAAGLQKTLEMGEFTIFAPNDGAFSELGSTALQNLLANATALKPILEFHMLPGTLLATDLFEGSYTTVQSSSLTIDSSRKRYRIEVNDVKLRNLNILSSNGAIHVINDVLSLPSGI